MICYKLLGAPLLDKYTRGIIFYFAWGSEFEELEAVPSLSVIEGPLEPPTSSAATPASDVPDDSFLNFFSVCVYL